MVDRSEPAVPRLTRDQRWSVAAAQLGWTVDALDYFVIVFIYPAVAETFRLGLVDVAFLATATLIMRPVGASIFGLWADRMGRSIPLLANAAFYSVAGLLCAFAPNFTVLVVLRLLYGIGMGAEWGLGAALTMEKVPVGRRGFFSSLIQQGEPCGYLLASMASLLVMNLCGLSWRWMFVVTTIPALIGLVIRVQITESSVWEHTQARMRISGVSTRNILMHPKNIRRFGYLVLLMTVFHWMALATQDIYPTFLSDAHHGGVGLSTATARWIAVIYNVGAIIGGFMCGSLSQRIGRRTTIVSCTVLALLTTPIAFWTHSAVLLGSGAFLMQMMVMGAWSGIPVYLTEMSPDAVRAFYPGMAYQVGLVFAAFALPVQQHLADAQGYPLALTVTVVPVFIVLAALTSTGREPVRGQWGSEHSEGTTAAAL
ncbi:MFS transporter [Nocardia sp. 2YAB30]|uniref:MFS transporter n=1 Tax=unclassified Nocardia TaxID=2637762 RepID=UPI003F993720